MLLEEVYRHYGENWSNVARELSLGFTTTRGWRKKGYIPYETQVLIEKKTNCLFIADESHDKSRFNKKTLG